MCHLHPGVRMLHAHFLGAGHFPVLGAETAVAAICRREAVSYSMGGSIVLALDAGPGCQWTGSVGAAHLPVDQTLAAVTAISGGEALPDSVGFAVVAAGHSLTVVLGAGYLAALAAGALVAVHRKALTRLICGALVCAMGRVIEIVVLLLRADAFNPGANKPAI